MIAIAALTPSRVIGCAGKLPWHFSEDLKFFKRTTIGHIVLMGRKTYDSIGRPLPGRENWVLSRGAEIPGVKCLASVEDIREPVDGRRVYVIGGAQIYELLLPQCESLILTELKREYQGDTYFPEFANLFEPTDELMQTEDFVVREYRRKTEDSLN